MSTTTRIAELDVLIIDDDAELCGLVEAVLRHHDGPRFGVRRAGTAEAGLAAYDLRPADIVVLDLGLPDSSRADPLRLLRELLSRHPTPCVVVLTGHPWGLGREAVRMGAQDYLDKGAMAVEQLRDAILYAVERHAHVIRNASISALARDRASTHPGQPGSADRLRTPLATLTKALEELRRDHQLAGPELHLLDQALRGAYALGGQLDQVVAAQRRLVDRSAVDLTMLARTVVADLHDLVEAVEAEVEVEELALLWGQSESLHRLLRNLVRNALQHGGHGVRIRVAARSHPRGTHLLVEDSGPGIPAHLRSELFEPGASRARGFGLRACAAVASAHGGRCWIEDSPLGGARVVVELPVRRRTD